MEALQDDRSDEKGRCLHHPTILGKGKEAYQFLTRTICSPFGLRVNPHRWRLANSFGYLKRWRSQGS